MDRPTVNIVKHDPHALAHQLSVTLPQQGSEDRADIATFTTTAVEPVDLDRYPAVRDVLADVTGDRSKDTMRVVGACCDAGLTLPQTRHVVGSRPDLAQRLAERRDDDVHTCWLKAVDMRQQRRVRRPSTDGVRSVRTI
jgi:hypothetical protein